MGWYVRRQDLRVGDWVETVEGSEGEIIRFGDDLSDESVVFRCKGGGVSSHAPEYIKRAYRGGLPVGKEWAS